MWRLPRRPEELGGEGRGFQFFFGGGGGFDLQGALRLALESVCLFHRSMATKRSKGFPYWGIVRNCRRRCARNSSCTFPQKPRRGANNVFRTLPFLRSIHQNNHNHFLFIKYITCFGKNDTAATTAHEASGTATSVVEAGRVSAPPVPTTTTATTTRGPRPTTHYSRPSGVHQYRGVRGATPCLCPTTRGVRPDACSGGDRADSGEGARLWLIWRCVLCV